MPDLKKPKFPSEINWPLGPNGTQVHQRDRKSKEEMGTLGPQRELKVYFDVILPREDKSWFMTFNSNCSKFLLVSIPELSKALHTR